MDDYNALLKQSLDLKGKRQEKYRELSKDRLYKVAKKKIQTTMIGALDTIEKSFGFLWESDEELSNEQVQLKAIFEDARSQILDRGNTQMRNLEAEMTQYDISWNRHTINLPVVEKGEDNER
jgi:transcription termination factor Rho